MTEDTQDKFDNILIPPGPRTMIELSNQDLLTFIQSQSNNTPYQGLQNNNMQKTNNPKFVTNTNETQFFPRQEPSSTTQDQTLHSFNHNYKEHELAIPKEHHSFIPQTPFQVTNPNHERFTDKTTSIFDQSHSIRQGGNTTMTVNKDDSIKTSSQYLKLYQDQNWRGETNPEITTKNNPTVKQTPKKRYKAKTQELTTIPKQTVPKRKQDTPSPILFSPDKQKTVIAPPHKRTSRNINSSKYAKLRAILEQLEDQEHSPKSPHSKNKKQNKTLHHFQIEVVHIMKEDMSRLIEKNKPAKPKKSS